MQNIFNKPEINKLIERINKLTSTTQPQWGTMDIAKMLAHCNVTYELVYEEKHPKAGLIKKIFYKVFIKSMVVNERPFKRNGPTSPEFLVKGDKDFDIEKERLINFIIKTQELGENYFDNRESSSFGKLTAVEWNNMFVKHLDHHLTQFGV